MLSRRVRDICRRLELGGRAYQIFLKRNLSMNILHNAYEALVSFAKGFAYERQGSPLAYRIIAEEALRKVFKGKIKTIRGQNVNLVWQEYQSIAKDFNIGVNPTHNPMNSDRGILARMKAEGVTNIASYIENLLRNGQTRKAFRFLDSIRGIGPKIASFYLRDIACLTEIRNIQDDHLLQPVDTWVDQVLQIIMDVDPSLKPSGHITDAAKRKLITKICRDSNCSPVAFNQGAWFIGSRIARDFRTLNQILTSSSWPKCLQQIIVQRIKEKQDEIGDLQALVKQLPLAPHVHPFP